jgi:hypothetical protein
MMMIELWFIDFLNNFNTYHMSSREGMFHEWCVKHFQWLFRVLCNTCILNWLLFLLKKKLVTLPLLKLHMFPYLLCFLQKKKKKWLSSLSTSNKHHLCLANTIFLSSSFFIYFIIHFVSWIPSIPLI